MIGNLSQEDKHSDSKKPPGTHILYIWDFHADHLSLGQLRYLNYGGILKLLILANKLFTSNSETEDIVIIKFCHVSVPHFCVFDLVTS